MSRLPLIVLPGIPHHITQRGNRRERTFFEDGDYELYLDLLAEAAKRAGVGVWSYCLMPNHVHIIATPSDEDGLRRTFRHVHRHYTGYINARMRVTYSPNGKRISIKDANGNLASMTFDGFDRQTKWNFPSKTSAGTVSTTDFEQYGYDANGNRLTSRKRDGRTLTFAYDAMNRMTSKLVPDGCAPIQVGPCIRASATRDVFYSYDIFGRQLTAKFDSAAGADGLTSAYDIFGNLTSSTISMGGFSKTLNAQYDVANRRTQLTHPDGQAFTYAYDAADRLSGVYEGVGTAVPLDTFTYNPVGALGSRSERLGSGVTYGYDGINRLTSQADTFVGATGNVARTFAYTPNFVNPRRSRQTAQFLSFHPLLRSA